MSLDKTLAAALEQRRQQQRYRQRSLLASAQQVQAVVNGRECLCFSGNDYLGLANHPALIDALQEASAEYGVGSGASHLVNGHSHYHHELELALARFTGRERALLFSTGYMANMGIVSALTGRGDTVFQDKLNHASLIDGGLLSRADFKRFRHNDAAHLRQQLKASNSPRKLVVVDGVFSMDGDIAPLPELASACSDHDAWLMVDDAHGFGVLGEQGGGCAQYFGLNSEQLPVLVGTFGKAFGSFGAFVAGSETLIESLIQFARPYIYTTALPPAVAAATLTSLELIQNEPALRLKLQENIQHFTRRAAELGLPLMPSSTAIQPLVLGEDARVMQVANALKEQGILVGAIRPPTVPEGTGRLRMTLSAAHSLEQIDSLLDALDKLLPDHIRVQP